MVILPRISELAGKRKLQLELETSTNPSQNLKIFMLVSFIKFCSSYKFKCK